MEVSKVLSRPYLFGKYLQKFLGLAYLFAKWIQITLPKFGIVKLVQNGSKHLGSRAQRGHMHFFLPKLLVHLNTSSKNYAKLSGANFDAKTFYKLWKLNTALLVINTQ